MRKQPDRKKQVLYLPRWYPNRFDPMPGLFIRRHALSVAKDYEVSVLAVHLNFSNEADLYETESSDVFGIHEISIYTRAARTGIRYLDSMVNLYRFFAAHRKGFKMLRKMNRFPGLIHVNVLTRLGFIAMLCKVFTGTPYVITEHWTRYLAGMENFRGTLRKALTRIVVRHASAVLPVTKNLQLSMERHGLTNPHYYVIPNVVDTKMFRPVTIPCPGDTKMILHVSCFDDVQKNISGMLRVLQRLSMKRQDWRCTMVGEGIHYEKLVRMAEQLQIKDSFVFFTGLRENEDLAELMRRACFQVMFSRYENLPVVIPESFACGVPFLSTNVGGIAEHILPFNGRLIHSEDEEALFNALEEMLDHAADFDKNAIRQYALDHFSQEVVGKQIGEVYRRVIVNSE